MLPANADRAWCLLSDSGALIERATPDRRTCHPVIPGVDDDDEVRLLSVHYDPVPAPLGERSLDVVACDRVCLRLIQRLANIGIDYHVHGLSAQNEFRDLALLFIF